MASLASLPLTASGPDTPAPQGRTEPRLWTPPLRELTPATSYGYDVAEFAAEVLEHPLDPWQEWLAVHGGELLPDGRPRFRKLVVLVARQNGKTELLVVLSLFWQFVQAVPLILGTSTKLDYAKESWTKAVRLAERSSQLTRYRPAPRWRRDTNGEQESWTLDGARYKIAASNEEGGRSLTIDRLILDELRQHHSYSAWDASVPAGNAVPTFQAWALSNAGDDNSIVLNDLRESALRYIDTGEGDPRLGLFEWSSPDGASPLDVDALAQANPNLGRRIHPDDLLADAARAVALGGDALAGFRTENMCQRVRRLHTAVDPDAWAAGLEPGDLSAVRDRVACCVDVAPDGEHVTLVAAAVLPDGRVRGEVVRAWDNTTAARRALPGLIRRVRPRALGWFPNGPAAALAADLAERGQQAGRAAWPPPGVKVEAIKGDVVAVCMGLDALVKANLRRGDTPEQRDGAGDGQRAAEPDQRAGQRGDDAPAGGLVHSGDPLLDAHVTGAERRARGDGWVFSRRGGGHCDAAYALAGAVHLARTLPPPVGKPRVIVVTDD